MRTVWTALALIVVTAASGAPMPVTPQERDALRDACAKLRGDKPATSATRAEFKRCVDQIPFDGDLPKARQKK